MTTRIYDLKVNIIPTFLWTSRKTFNSINASAVYGSYVGVIREGNYFPSLPV